MSKITTRDGVDIFYKDWGKGQPIVFSHGWPLSSDDWDAQMMFFVGKGFRVIAHDRRGRLRLEEACRLLTSSNQSISEIALSVGFQTPSAFAARFRKTVGLTPREFRRSRGFFSAAAGPGRTEPAWLPVQPASGFPSAAHS